MVSSSNERPGQTLGGRPTTQPNNASTLPNTVSPEVRAAGNGLKAQLDEAAQKRLTY